MTERGEKYRDISDKIFSFLSAMGISVSQAAREMGLTQAALSCIKIGRNAPSLELLAYVASKGADVNAILIGRPGRPTAAGPLSATMQVLVDDFGDLDARDQVRLAEEVRQLAATARAKKDKAKSG